LLKAKREVRGIWIVRLWLKTVDIIVSWLFQDLRVHVLHKITMAADTYLHVT